MTVPTSGVKHRHTVRRNGRIEQVASPADLTEAPATPYVAELLARSGLAAEAPS